MNPINTLVNHTVSYSGDGAYGHHTKSHFMTQQEADNFVGYMEKKVPFVPLNWGEINARTTRECNITRIVNVGQCHSCSQGGRFMDHAPVVIDLVG